MEEALPITIAGLLTFLSPLLTSFFTKRNMSAQAKSWIAVVISAVIAVVYVFLQGGFAAIAGPEEFFAALGIAYGIGQLAYNTLLKSTAKTIEAKYGVTSPAPAEESKQDVADGEIRVTVPEDYRGNSAG